jgi:hypothetical protein
MISTGGMHPANFLLTFWGQGIYTLLNKTPLLGRWVSKRTPHLSFGQQEGRASSVLVPNRKVCSRCRAPVPKETTKKGQRESRT